MHYSEMLITMHLQATAHTLDTSIILHLKDFCSDCLLTEW